MTSLCTAQQNKQLRDKGSSKTSVYVMPLKVAVNATTLRINVLALRGLFQGHLEFEITK